MTKTKLTREQKREAEAAERRSKRIAEYRQRVERDREKPVAASASEVFALGRHVESKFFNRESELSLLYSVISRFEYAHRNYNVQRSWLQSRISEVERNAAENYIGSSDAENVARTAIELATAGASLKASADAAAEACHHLGVYCPAIYSVREQQRREVRLGLRVEKALPVDGKEWMLSRVSAEPLGSAFGEDRVAYYSTEDDAWTALAGLAGDGSEVQ